MRAQLAATPQSIPGVGDSGGTATGQIAHLQGQINRNLARGWTESHPDIVSARQQIARLRPYAAAERQSGNTGGMSNPSYVSLRAMMAEREAALAAATARRNQLQSDLAQLTSRQSTQPGLAAEQTRLTRDYDVLKQQYDQLLANREQVRLRSDVQTRTSPLTIKVVEPPSVPTRAGGAEPADLPDRGADPRPRRRPRRRVRRRPAPDHLPDPAQARRGDRPAGARHGQRGR